MKLRLRVKLTPELVHLAVDEIYPYMGKLGMEKRLSLLRKYMDDAPSDAEHFWAHDELADSLAILDRNREAIEEHSRLYRWACQHLPDKYVLKVISNLHTSRMLGGGRSY